MRILIVTDELTPGGVARHVCDLANGLVDRGHAVWVAATPGPWRAKLNGAVRFESIPFLTGHPERKSLRGPFVGTWRLIRLVRRNKIQLIHSHKRYSDSIARFVAWMTGIPHLSTSHNTFANLGWLTRFGDFTIAVSKSVRENLVKDFGLRRESTQTVYNGILPIPPANDNEIARTRAVMGLQPGQQVIVNIARNVPAKDQATLIAAIALLRDQKRIGNAVVFIVGSGSERENLESMVQSLSLMDRVRFFPETSEIGDILRIANFGVLSSVQEGLPYVLLEAASLGIPHLATRTGGVEEFVEHEITGLLVGPGSPEALAKEIARLLEDPSLVRQLGENARHRYHARHSLEGCIAETIKVYHRLVLKPPEL